MTTTTVTPKLKPKEDIGLLSELEVMFSEENEISCECSHIQTFKGKYCSMDLHADGELFQKKKPCKKKAEWMLVLSGICPCERPIQVRPYYLCERCAMVWSELAVHSEKL